MSVMKWGRFMVMSKAVYILSINNMFFLQFKQCQYDRKCVCRKCVCGAAGGGVVVQRAETGSGHRAADLKPPSAGTHSCTSCVTDHTQLHQAALENSCSCPLLYTHM